MKDSGNREQYASGMVREPQGDRPRFDLLIPRGVPYDAQMLTRFAQCLATGASKYAERNWEQANSQTELERYYASAFRHFMQWQAGVDDGEDHAAAVMFNILAAETVKWRIENESKS